MGNEVFMQMLTNGITWGAIGSLGMMAMAFILGTIYYNRILDLLGYFWFKKSPLDIGFVIHHPTSTGSAKAEIKSADMATLTLEYPHIHGSRGQHLRLVRHVPMAKLKAEAVNWCVQQPVLNDDDDDDEELA